MVRILRVVASMNPALGGVTEAIRVVCEAQKTVGHKVEVVTSDAPHAPWLKNFAFPVHGLGPGRFGWAYSKALTQWLRANCNRFELIVVDGLWLHPSHAVHRTVPWARKDTSTPNGYWVMPHGMLDPWFQSWRRRPFKTLRNALYWRLIEKHVVSSANGLLFTCEQERRLARKTFPGYRPQREVVTGLGITSPPPFDESMRAAFRRKCPQLACGEPGRTGDRPYLLFLSRIHEKKGVTLLLEAYASIRSEWAVGSRQLAERAFPDLVIAGPGLETAYGQKLLRLCEKLRLPVHLPAAPNSPLQAPSSELFAEAGGQGTGDRSQEATESETSANRQLPTANSESPQPAIHFAGMLTGDSKWGAFYGCDAFVLPSHQENFGIVVAEALACGKPVLISDQVNIWQEIEAAGAGFVAPDTEEGARALLERWFASSPEERKATESNARTAFDRNFRVEAAAEALVALAREEGVNEETGDGDQEAGDRRRIGVTQENESSNRRIREWRFSRRKN